MSDFAAAMDVMVELFAKDCVFAFATANANKPSVRMVDAYYEDGVFYVVTYAKSTKVKDLEANKQVALCDQFHRFDGVAHNIGHPLAADNLAIREKLIQVFEPWYFAHNNEKDEAMCYVKFQPHHGFFHQGGVGYTVDFKNETVKTSPFMVDVVLP